MDEEVMIGHDGTILFNSVTKEIGTPKVNFHGGLDGINNQLTVSRAVSDSVTRGMLNAVETEDVEKIAQKELHQSRMKGENETLHPNLILDEACKDEYEEQRLLEPKVESCGWKSLLLDRTNEIAALLQELELVSKLLTSHENRDIESLEDTKRADQLHGKIPGSIVSASTNGKLVGSNLRKLSHEQLINYFKSEINQLKREHDYAIQEMTEEYFSIKGRYLNLEKCGSFSSLKTDKEFDALRKKIPDIILKLDKVLLEGEKSVFERKNDAVFKSQLDSLLLENRQLKDSLSKADQKVSQLSQVEENHRKLIRKLESDAEDMHVEASIYADVYRTFLGEFVGQIQSIKERTYLEHHIMRDVYELISRDLVNRVASEIKSDLEDSCVESYMTEEYCTVMYKETLKEADKKLGELNINVFDKERALTSEMVEKERLKEEIHLLERFVEEKENLIKIVENDLATEREKLEIQINNLQYQVSQQAIVIQDQNKEVKAVAEVYEMEISDLKQKLELARKDMKISEHDKVKSELKLSSAEAEQKRLKNQFVSAVLSVAKWSKDFDNLECVVAEKTRKTSSRLKSMQDQLSVLLDEVDELKARESIYKQLMEKKTCDLQKAETEVDLLGNEVESLLELLGKIYIALDHYSPILKHYRGIVEILKLVRRKLRGESKRPSVC